jgi:hypothetical protein
MSSTKSCITAPESRFFRPTPIAYALPAVPGRPNESIPWRSHLSKKRCFTSSNRPLRHSSTTMRSPRPWWPASSLRIFWMISRYGTYAHCSYSRSCQKPPRS